MDPENTLPVTELPAEAPGQWRLGLGIHLAVAAAVSILAYTSNLPEAWLAVPFFDKLGHFLLVGGAAYWLRYAFRARYILIFGKKVPHLLLGAMLIAVAEETAQLAAPNRNADIWDLLIGLGGMGLFWWLAGRWTRRSRRQP